MQNYKKVPRELRERRQWVLWKRERDTKVPYTIGGYRASSTRPSDWYSFAEVVETLASSQGFDGIGFVFTADDPYLGIDIDDCYEENNRSKPWARRILAAAPDTYHEVSPSGDGLKLIVRAKNPLPRGRKVTVEDGGLEMYDQGRFFTITGDCDEGIEVADGQEWVNWLAKTYFPEPTAPERPQSVPVSDISDDWRLERASQYLASIDPAIAGQNGHATTFRAACKLVIGFDLGADEAFSLLWSEYNPRCQPPWSEKELRHKVNSALKEPGERGYLLAEESDFVSFSADLSNLFGPNEPSEPRKPVDPLLFPPECMRPPGLISEIIDYTLKTSLYPQPELALAGAIALIATVTSRKLADANGTRTNMYILGLAPSGSGKEQARKTNKTLLAHAGAQDRIGPERIASSAGLVTAVADHPAILLQLDEVGRLLQTLKNPEKSPHLYNIVTVLMQLYSSADTTWIGDAYADAKKVRTVDQPGCCIYGTSVPESFWGSLSSENLTDGMLGRMLTFESSVGYPKPKTPEAIDPDPKLVESLKWWIDYEPNGLMGGMFPQPVLAKHSVDAQTRYYNHRQAIYDRLKDDDDRTRAIWMRSAEKAGKLALVFAASRCQRTEHITIELEDVDRGIKLANYLTKKLILGATEHVTENFHESSVRRVQEIIHRNPAGLTKTELLRKTRWLKKRDRDEILEYLLAAEKITLTEIPGDGNKWKKVIQGVL